MDINRVEFISEESQKSPSTAHCTHFRYKLVTIFPLIQ